VCKTCGEEGHRAKFCKAAAAATDDTAAEMPAGDDAVADAVADVEEAAPASPRPVNGCKFCGSEDHLSRKCPNKDAGAASPAPPAKAARAEQRPAAPAAPAPAPVVRASGDGCKFCGSPDHLSRLCPDKSAGQRPAAPAAPAATPAPAPVAPVVRASGDGCKFCGSSEHLSRLCPDKKKGVGASAPAAAPAAAASPAAELRAKPSVTTPTATSCFFCGEEGHKGRDCPKKDAQMAQARAAQAAPAPRAAAPAAVPIAAAGAGVRKFADSDDDDDAPIVPKARASVPAPAAAPAARAAPAAAASPRSKDACKFCGSEAHLSRQCPNKNKK